MFEVSEGWMCDSIQSSLLCIVLHLSLWRAVKRLRPGSEGALRSDWSSWDLFRKPFDFRT